jgi:hypothetical protein
VTRRTIEEARAAGCCRLDQATKVDAVKRDDTTGMTERWSRVWCTTCERWHRSHSWSRDDLITKQIRDALVRDEFFANFWGKLK